MEVIFKPEHVGQVVSDPNFGDGVITNYDPRTTYSVEVRFEPTGLKRWYKPEGWHNGCILPTLQFGSLDNWQRRTEPQLRDGDLIEVKTDDLLSWRIGVVKNSQSGDPIVVIGRNDNGLPIVATELTGKQWRFFKP